MSCTSRRPSRLAATQRPKDPRPLTEPEIEAIAERLHKGEYLDAQYLGRLFRQPKEYELTYARKESRGSILAGTMGIPLQTLRRFGEPIEGWSNKLIFGDNLQVLKTLFKMKERGELLSADGTPGIRLCYIDPPFATRQEFRGKQDEMAYADKIIGARFLEFLRKRLVIIHELLSDDGSLYVHLDTRKSHYVKVLLDEIFGEDNFRNEIVWKRTTAHNDAATMGSVHETILFYSKSDRSRWVPQFVEHDEAYVATYYRYKEPDGRPFMSADYTGAGAGPPRTFGERGEIAPPPGRHWMHDQAGVDRRLAENRIFWTRNGIPRLKRYLDESPGQPLHDVWTDILPIVSWSSERVGYPTQKPTALLERIITSSSEHGDLVLDCFAGSGTAAVVADRLKRRWIAVDCGKLAIYTTQRRLLVDGGEGFDLCSAGLYDNDLLEKLPFPEFQSFCLDLFGCRPRRHTISEVPMAGTRKGAPVHFFPYDQTDALMGRAYIDSLHERIGSKVSGSVCIVAPVAACDPGLFEDIVQLGKVSYFVLRVPYSVIEALHDRGFDHIEQPASAEHINDPLDAYGFDFIELPEVTTRTESVGDVLRLHIDTFMRGGLDPDDFKELPDAGRGDLAMVMVDANYDGELFRISQWRFADDLKATDWTVSLRLSECGKRLMVVFLDTHGNERREIVMPATAATPRRATKARVRASAG